MPPPQVLVRTLGRDGAQGGFQDTTLWHLCGLSLGGYGEGCQTRDSELNLNFRSTKSNFFSRRISYPVIYCLCEI